MKIGVIGIPQRWSSETLADTIRQKTGFRCLIDMNSITCNISAKRLSYKNINLTDLDALIIKKIGTDYKPYMIDRLELLNYYNKLGLKIFSRPSNIKKAINRLTCTSILSAGNIPMPPTSITENIKEAEEIISSYKKAILKPLFTSKAKGMSLIESDHHTIEKLISFRNNQNPVLYIQKMVEIPGRDLGIVFIGGKYLATYSRVIQTGSWNTTIRTGGRYEPYDPSDEIINMAKKAQDLFSLDFTCVDIAETPDGPVVFEVSPFGGFRGLKEANNIHAAEIFSEYVISRIS